MFDSDVLNFFRKELGEKLIYLERERVKYWDEKGRVRADSEIKCDEKKVNKFEREKNYIIEIYMLSKCQAILCGKGSGAAAAFVLNNGKYEYKEIY